MTPSTDDRYRSGAATATSGSSDTTGGGGRSDAAKQEAGHLKDTTAEASGQVVETAKEQVAQVAGDVKAQTGRLAAETRDQLAGQASEQRDRAVQGLRSISDELRAMADQGGQDGWAAQLARHGSQLSREAADYLQDHQPGEVLDEVRNLARRRPGAFQLGAACAGVVAGRLTRAVTAANRRGSATETMGNETMGNGRIGTEPMGSERADDPPPGSRR